MKTTMKVLVLNAGSSSLKYQLLTMPAGDVICQGVVERIGIDGGIFTHKVNGEKIKLNQDVANHKDAMDVVLGLMTEGENAVLSSMDEIDAIGHRVVHGGEYFAKSAVVTDEVIDAITKCEALAPLHNPANKTGILACKELMPTKPQVVVFDTAFHQTMPAESYMYGIPKEYYEKYGVRRYGFHGTSHYYVSNRAAEILGKDVKDLKIITAHVGNGASLAAIDGGKVVDTSMGFTPLEGLVMGTRSGDMDPAIVTFLMEKEGLSSKDMDAILNKKSGVFGLSGVSPDMRDIEDGFVAGKEDESLAMKVYLNRIVKYIGAYAARMNGVDAIVMTAGVLENSTTIREEIAKRITFLGTELDASKNDFRGEERIISKDGSKVQLMVVPTNEEFVIANDTYELCK